MKSTRLSIAGLAAVAAMAEMGRAAQTASVAMDGFGRAVRHGNNRREESARRRARAKVAYRSRREQRKRAKR